MNRQALIARLRASGLQSGAFQVQRQVARPPGAAAGPPGRSDPSPFVVFSSSGFGQRIEIFQWKNFTLRPLIGWIFPMENSVSVLTKIRRVWLF